MKLLSVLVRWCLAALLAGLVLARPIGMVVDLHRGAAVHAVLGSLASTVPGDGGAVAGAGSRDASSLVVSGGAPARPRPGPATPVFGSRIP